MLSLEKKEEKIKDLKIHNPHAYTTKSPQTGIIKAFPHKRRNKPYIAKTTSKTNKSVCVHGLRNQKLEKSIQYLLPIDRTKK